MTPHPNKAEATRRVRQACDLISTAYRLHTLDPAATIGSVRRAIVEGAQAAADDVKEAVERA